MSGFYFFYFASLGALIPYWGLYLKSLDFSSQQIGLLLAMLMSTKLISPNVWGWIADHTGRRMAIVRLGCVLAIISFSGVFFVDSFWWLAGVMALYSFFWNATLPQFEATTLNYLGKHATRYAGIRVWGSIGFIVAVVILGEILQREGALVLPIFVLMLFIGIWLASLFVPERSARHLSLHVKPLRQVVKTPTVAALLVVCFLMQLSHGPYYSFYSIYLEQQAYSRSVIGQLWALAVIAEVFVFLAMQRLSSRFGLRKLLLASLLIASLRWLIIGSFPQEMGLLILAQLFHGASFGVYHAVAIQLIHRHFTGNLQGRGQALYSSLSFGAGGALGVFFSGIVWDSWGPMLTFATAASASLLGAIICWRWVKID